MTDEIMALRELMEKNADADLLREMIGFADQRLTEQPVRNTYIRPFTTARRSTLRLPPPPLDGGIRGSISAHSSSVRWFG